MSVKRGTLDTERATALLLDFLRDHALALAGEDLDDHVIDLTFEGEVDQLCARLAADPETALVEEPAAVRALFSWRLLRVIACMELWPGVLDGAIVLGPLDDAEARAFLIGGVLSAARIPSSFHGQLFDMPDREPVH